MKLRRYFLCLVLIQGLHSIEEFYGSIWENFPPATALCNMLSDNPEYGFLVINITLFAFGIICWRFVVDRPSTYANVVLWIWIVIELINGIGHPVWTILQGRYTAGVATSPLLLIFALLLMNAFFKNRT